MVIESARFTDPAGIGVTFREGDTDFFADFEDVKARLAASGIQAPAAYVAPTPTVADVRAEAQRRIIALVGARDLPDCLVRQLNATMRAVEITNKQALGGALTAQEMAEAAALEGLAAAIKAIRAASNVLEGAPPIDFKSNQHWPGA